VFNASNLTGPETGGNFKSINEVRKSLVEIDHLHLFKATEKEKLGVLRTTSQQQLLFRLGGGLHVEFRGESREATVVEIAMLIGPYSASGFGDATETVRQFGRASRLQFGPTSFVGADSPFPGDWGSGVRAIDVPRTPTRAP
jgi:hypothetical protein